ncbi:hypothetical protein [Klebsiella quasipneumoniae]|nr:hypothetical protein [Klebsiella quasipneumoniae]
MCAVTTRLRDQGVTLIFLKEQLTFSAGTTIRCRNCSCT